MVGMTELSSFGEGMMLRDFERDCFGSVGESRWTWIVHRGLYIPHWDHDADQSNIAREIRPHSVQIICCAKVQIYVDSRLSQ